MRSLAIACVVLACCGCVERVPADKPQAAQERAPDGIVLVAEHSEQAWGATSFSIRVYCDTARSSFIYVHDLGGGARDGVSIAIAFDPDNCNPSLLKGHSK